MIAALLLAASLPASAVAVSTAAPSYCAPGYAVERLEAEIGGLVREHGQAAGEFQWFFQYADCVALAEKDPARCELLGPWDELIKGKGEDSRRIECKKNVLQAKVSRAAISGKPPLSQVCDDLDKNPAMRGNLVPSGCRWLAEHPGDAEGACKEALAKVTSKEILASPPEERMKRCLPIFEWMLGRGECSARSIAGENAAGGPGHGHEMRCPIFHAYRRAFEKKDPKLCGDYPLCRAMMGEGTAACRDYAKKKLAQQCRRFR